jgi:hypothetical protein
MIRACAESLTAPSLLIDLDLMRDRHAAHYGARGLLGAGADARLDGASFHRIVDANGQRVAERALTRHRVGATALSVTAFARSAVPAGGRTQVSAACRYWEMLRAQSGLTLVDAPPLERAPYARDLAERADGVVLVVSDEPGSAPAAMAARAALDQAGARVLGIVYAQSEAPPRFITKLMRYAGDVAAAAAP